MKGTLPLPGSKEKFSLSKDIEIIGTKGDDVSL